MKKINLRYVSFGILLILVYGIVFLLPGSQEKFSVDPTIEGEYWRWGTYQFTHVAWGHLIENIITLGVVSLIAIELKTNFNFFSVNYILAGLVAIVPLWIMSPFVALGASVAIFSSFGLISPEAKQFKVKVWLVISGIMLFIFMKPIWILIGATGEMDFALKQALAHFSGFAFGLAGFYGFRVLDRLLIKRKQYVLRRV